MLLIWSRNRETFAVMTKLPAYIFLCFRCLYLFQFNMVIQYQVNLGFFIGYMCGIFIWYAMVAIIQECMFVVSSLLYYGCSDPIEYSCCIYHLDFVGVELRDTFIQTRKANGDQLQSRIKNTVGPWKAGKFMPITLRPFSANTYALSKVWFKCSAINLRIQDINTINTHQKESFEENSFKKSRIYITVCLNGRFLFFI